MPPTLTGRSRQSTPPARTPRSSHPWPPRTTRCLARSRGFRNVHCRQKWPSRRAIGLKVKLSLLASLPFFKLPICVTLASSCLCAQGEVAATPSFQAAFARAAPTPGRGRRTAGGRPEAMHPAVDVSSLRNHGDQCFLLHTTRLLHLHLPTASQGPSSTWRLFEHQRLRVTSIFVLSPLLRPLPLRLGSSSSQAFLCTKGPLRGRPWDAAFDLGF